MAAPGVELRAQIDAETVKALLYMHGGASIALLAFLPSVFEKPVFSRSPRQFFGRCLYIRSGSSARSYTTACVGNAHSNTKPPATSRSHVIAPGSSGFQLQTGHACAVGTFLSCGCQSVCSLLQV
jgi:hypothetical protein